MTDRPEMPYENSITETAKTAGKALDIVQSMSPAIASAYGFVIGDRINAQRERQLDALARKTKKILRDRDAKEEHPVPEQIAVPLLEAAQGETREEIQDLFAALLANAMDPAYTNDVRPEFIATVKALQPQDAKIFKVVSSQDSFAYERMKQHFPGVRDNSIRLSIEHLTNLHLLRQLSGWLNLTPYGREVMIACDSHALPPSAPAGAVAG